MGHSLGDSIRIYDRDNDGIIDAAAVGVNFVGWGYQDFAAGTINSTTVTITSNENGTTTNFDPLKIIGNSAVISLAANENTVPYSGSLRLLSKMVQRTEHSGEIVTLNAIPHSSWGTVRIWYKYLYNSMPVGYQMAGTAIAGKLYPELDTNFTSEEEFSAKVNQDLKTTASPTFAGLFVDGNLTINGAAYETHAEKIFTKNNLMYLRDGAVAGLSAGEYVGLQARLYDGANDGMLAFDKNGIARVGDIGALQAIATREDAPANGGIAIWNSTAQRFDTTNTPNFAGLTVTGSNVWHAGNVGTAGSNLIGYTPANKIGDIFTGDLVINKTANQSVILTSDGIEKARFFSNAAGSAVLAGTTGIYLRPSGYLNSDSQLYIPANGNLLIGTTTDTGEKLQVNGTSMFNGFFTVIGTQNAPLTTGTATNGSMRLTGITNLVLDMGVQAGTNPYSWLQSRLKTDYTSNYPLAINPNGGNVLIGTTSDTGEKLQVNGSGKFLGALYRTSSGSDNAYINISATGTGDAGIVFDGSDGDFIGLDYGILAQRSADLSVELANQGANPIWLSTAQNKRLGVLGNGNVIIGTTTDTGEKLQVNGSAKISGVTEIIDTSNVAHRNLVLSGAWGSSGKHYNLLTFQATHILNSNVFADISTEGQKNFHIGITSDVGYFNNDRFSIIQNGSERFCVNNTGNILVGTTTDTGEKLQVNGNSKITGNLEISTAGSGGTYGLRVFGQSGSARSVFVAGQQGYSNGFTIDYTGTTLQYKFVDGNVIIGSTYDDGSNKLQVAGSISSGSILATGYSVNTSSGIATFSNTDYPRFYTTGINTGSYPFDAIGHLIIQPKTTTTRDIIFRTSNVDKALIVKYTGNILIGTTTDTGEKLQVNGSISAAVSGDNIPILKLNIERPWFFRQIGTGAGAFLDLKPENTTKRFSISDASNFKLIEFVANGTSSSNAIYSLADGGRFLIGSTTDDGINKLQVTGSIAATGTIKTNSKLVACGGGTTTAGTPTLNGTVTLEINGVSYKLATCT